MMYPIGYAMFAVWNIIIAFILVLIVANLVIHIGFAILTVLVELLTDIVRFYMRWRRLL